MISIRKSEEMDDISEFTNLKVVLCAIFIFLGCFAFYISSLISGHNIYRDMSFSLSMFTTMLVGFILFVFSPIGFIVLFPELFLIPTPKHPREFLADIHPLVLNAALPPYLFLATGFGLIIGCLRVVQIRRLVLELMRDRGEIDFGIRSYEYTWDHFLSKIKRYGKLTIKQRGVASPKPFRLMAFSTQNEPRALVLESQDGHKDVFFADLSGVEFVEVPRSSMKRGFLSEGPASIAIHFSLAAIGFVLVSVGFVETKVILENYFRGKVDYRALYNWYQYAAYICAFSAALFFILAIYEMRREYASLRVAFVLCPWPFRITAAGFLLALAAGAFMFNLYESQDRWSIWSWHYGFLVAGSCLLIVAIMFMQNRLRRLLKQFFDKIKVKIAKWAPEDKHPDVSEALWSIVLNYDVNRRCSKPLISLMDEQFRDVPGVRQVVEAIQDRHARPKFLGEEDVSVLRSFLWYWDRAA